MVDKSQAQEFVNRWKAALEDVKDESVERKFCQTFWNELSDLITGSHWDDLEFEERAGSGGFIDVFSPGKFIVEQKSKEKSLDKTFQQAKRYDDNLVADKKVKTIVTSNFEAFWFYDLMTEDGINGKTCAKVALEEIPDNLELFKDLFGGEEEIKRENAVDKADEVANIAAELRDALENSVDQAKSKGASEEKCNEYKQQIPLIVMRIIFLLFADNTSFNEIKLFDNQQFRKFINGEGKNNLAEESRKGKSNKVESNLRYYLLELFKYLNTPEEDRANGGFDSIISDLDWPYIDGGLFEKSIDFPEFSVDVFKKLKVLSDYTHWDEITISNYGYLMDKSFPYDARRGDGVYFTSRENIQKVINPLFMDGLRAEFRKIKEEVKDHEDRQEKLKAFHDKLSRLQFFDPACGSGNFLTETYLELRKLEDEVIHLECGDNPIRDLDKLIQVTLSQFHGIELDPYTAQIARTALQIAHEQALSDSYKKLNITIPPQFFPLKRETNGITDGNSLEMNWGGDPEKKWNGVTPSENLYIFGNPPFIGEVQQKPSQKREIKKILEDFGKGGSKSNKNQHLDYCAGWFLKAAQFLNNSGGHFAFLATNSITHGTQVIDLFKPILNHDWIISFAYQPFSWDRRKDAAVTVVILGFSQNEDKRYLYSTLGIRSEVKNISPYLLPLPSFFIEAVTGNPISDLPACKRGVNPDPVKGFTLNEKQLKEAKNDPVIAKHMEDYIREYIGADEIIHDKKRWCLWLINSTPEDRRKSEFLKKRLAMISKKKKKEPWKIEGSERQPNCIYLAIPRVFQEHRPYFTVKYFSENAIAGDRICFISDQQGLAFAVLESSIFMTWQKLVGGRRETRLNFENAQVYNTFPLPSLTEDQKDRIIEGGAKVLEARANYPNASLADLYDPTNMPSDLKKAHEALDKAMDRVFSGKPLRSEEERQKALLEAYEEMTGEKAEE